MTEGQQERSTDPLVAGWREWVALPDFGVRRIKAKLDTGARTSSIHAFEIQEYRADGRPMVRFEVHPLQRSIAASVAVEAEVCDERMVRNSGGLEELRPVVLTTVTVWRETWPIELTLARRDEMGFRLLLGREALRGRVVVDPSSSFLTRSAGSNQRVKVRRIPGGGVRVDGVGAWEEEEE